MTGTSEISDKLTAALEAMERLDTAVAQVEHYSYVLSQATAMLVEASGGFKHFTRDGYTYLARKAKDGTWSLGVPRVQKGVEA